MTEGESERYRESFALSNYSLQRSQEKEILGVSINITDLFSFVQSLVASLGYHIAVLVCVLLPRCILKVKYFVSHPGNMKVS